MIARLVTQRACIDHAARALDHMPGAILEIGLGKGRTYDHIRRVFPDREVFVFDRHVHASPEFVPETDRLILGDLHDTLEPALAKIEGPIAMAHADIGSDDSVGSSELTTLIAKLLGRRVRVGGLVLGDRPFESPNWTPQALPADAADWPYYVYQAC